jgi:hypothetical protein
MTNDYHDCTWSPTIAMPGKHDYPDSDTIAMPGKARRNISRVSRRCFPLYSARHQHAARQASRRPTPGFSTPHAMHRIRTAYGSNYFPS